MKLKSLSQNLGRTLAEHLLRQPQEREGRRQKLKRNRAGQSFGLCCRKASICPPVHIYLKLQSHAVSVYVQYLPRLTDEAWRNSSATSTLRSLSLGLLRSLLALVAISISLHTELQ